MTVFQLVIGTIILIYLTYVASDIITSYIAFQKDGESTPSFMSMLTVIFIAIIAIVSLCNIIITEVDWDRKVF